MAELHRYNLGPIDGPLFRKQRLALLEVFDLGITAEMSELLDGLVNLLDEIADQAHDRYGVDCLLEEPEDDQAEEASDVPP